MQNKQTSASPMPTRAWDFKWVLSLFGTAVGAGILYLPLEAGRAGVWVLIIATLMIFPMTYWSHRNLTRIVAISPKAENITQVLDHYFGRHASMTLTVLYFLAFVSILMIYAIGITNEVGALLMHQFGFAHISRVWLSFVLIFCAIGVTLLGDKWLIKIASVLVYPLIIILLAMSIYLIPHWQFAMFHQVFSLGVSLKHLLMVLPILVFAMNFSPICSTLAVSYRQLMRKSTSQACIQRTDKVIRHNCVLLLIFVMFFAFSCTLCLTPQEIHEALMKNISVMSIFGAYSHSKFIQYVGPAISIIAIVTSIFGHFLGAREGLNGIIVKSLIWRKPHAQLNHLLIDIVVIILIFALLWWVAIENLGIVNMIGEFVAPIIAVILYLLPVIVIHKVPELKAYRSPVNIVVFLLGLVVIAGYVIGTFLY